jgi:anti-sigma-K factor RskA
VTDREELHLLSGAYALNALEGEEKERFEAYLLTSEEARAEVASLTDTAVLIGQASESVAPPADLKARLMAQIAVTPQLAPLPVRPNLTAVPAQPESIPSSTTDASAEAIRTASLGVPSAASRKAASRWYTRPASILVAAAAAVALFVGGNVLGLSSANEAQQQASALSAIVASADAQQVKADVSGGGKATFIWSADLERSAVVIDKLPALASGKTYELWYIDAKSNAIPAGTFDAAASGSTVRVLDGKLSSGDTLGITVEPSGGSKKPTTAPIVAVPSA